VWTSTSASNISWGSGPGAICWTPGSRTGDAAAWVTPDVVSIASAATNVTARRDMRM
jgi:hypothetical protein